MAEEKFFHEIEPMDKEVEPSLYEQMGGAKFFEELVSRFYDGIKADPVLRPMYPKEDLDGAIRRLTLFLSQYWGGPTTYSAERGHPRLRMRHNVFPIDGDARDRWLMHMSAALAQMQLAQHLRDQLWTYLVTAAHSMVNLPDN